MQDQELVVLYRTTGDQRYFEELFSRYRLRLSVYLQRLLGHLDWEPVLQATFLALHERCVAGHAIPSVDAWLFYAARLRAFELARTTKQKKRGGGWVRHHQPVDQIPTDLADPRDLVEQSDLAAWIRDQTEKLPAKQRRALERVFLEGRRLREAAMLEGVSFTTMKRQVRRGLYRLQKQCQIA